jgi:hypothetical protein
MTMPDLIISNDRNPHVILAAVPDALHAKADHVGYDFQGSNETNSQQQPPARHF